MGAATTGGEAEGEWERTWFAVSLVGSGGGAPTFFFRILITFLFTGSGGGGGCDWLSDADGRGISSMISSAIS